MLVSPISGATTEGGAQATFTVALHSKPSGDVTIPITSSNGAEGTVSPASLTFTSVNFAAPQTVTVTGIDDAIADGAVPYAIDFGAISSNDKKYAAIAVPPVPVVNVDNDSAGITVSPISGATSEGGGTAHFTVVLNSQPTGDVTVGLSSSLASEGTVSPASLTFTSANFAAPQTVTVTGVNDAIADGNKSYNVVFAAASSTDSTYSGMTPASVAVTNIDNDTANILVSAISRPTTEGSGTATFTVALTSQPTASVDVNFDTSDIAEGTPDVTTLTFSTTNYATAQTVTLTGADDDVADGNQPYAVHFTATTSNDAKYAAITPSDVAVTNIDNDTAQILVSAATGPTTEVGGQATFTVVLTSAPTDDVVIDFDTNDANEGTLDTTELTFDGTDYSAPQTVTASGIDDVVADGNQPYAVTFSPSTSNDPNYDGITPGNVLLTNVDNDSPGILVSAASGATSEAGGQATFTVVLNSSPTDTVTIDFDSTNTGEGTVTTTELQFDNTNYSTPQSVTVTGADDLVADGNQPYTVAFSASTSNDPNYNGLVPPSVSLTNVDNDSASILVTQISNYTTENGGTATFTVSLATPPTADVSINFNTSNAGEGTPDVTFVAFTAGLGGGYDIPQTVTVTGIDDGVIDGPAPYSILFAGALSGDPNYNGLTPAPVQLVNLDNDSSGSPAGFLIVEATFDPTFVSDVKAKLDPYFLPTHSRIDVFDASSSTPSLALLNQYDGILFYGDGTPFADPNALGNVLADYSDEGRLIVTGQFVEGGLGIIGGRFGDPNQHYLLLDSFDTEISGTPETLGTVAEPTSELMNGVVSISAQSTYAFTLGSLDPNAVVVAYWSDGTPMIVRGVGPLGGPRVWINTFPPSNDAAGGAYGFWTGDQDKVLRNALLYKPEGSSWNFDTGLQGWTVQDSSPTVVWAADATPGTIDGNPSFVSGPNSLNYDNGTDYDDPGNANNGSATSPIVDVSAMTSPTLTFWCNFHTEIGDDPFNYDHRFVEVSNDGFNTVLASVLLQPDGTGTAAGPCPTPGTWHQHTLALDPAWGRVQVRFRFDTVDAGDNNHPGWFLDDVSIQGN